MGMEFRILGPVEALSADGRSYCYSYVQFLSSLFVVDGLK